MPNIRIPLITGRPGPSGPRITAEAFGAARARGLGALGQGIETGSQAAIAGLLEIAKTNQAIEDAKQEQILWEKTAQGQAAIDEARFLAQDKIPSEATVEGQIEGQITPDKDTLVQEYESAAQKSISTLSEGLSGLRLEQFESQMRVFEQRGLLQIRQEERRRNIDAGRAAFARQEETLMSLAADANSNVDELIEQKKAAGAAAVESGLWGQHEMELNLQAFERSARKTHEAAQFNAQVVAAVDGFMSINLPKGDRVAAARDILPDGPLEKEVVRQIKLQSDEEEGRIIQSQKEAAERSWGAIRKGGGETVIEAGVTESDRRAMDTFIRLRAERAAKGAVFSIATDATVYSEVLGLAGSDVDAFLELNLLDPKFRMKLSDKEWNFFDRLQGEFSVDRSGGKQGQAILGMSEIINTTMDQSGITNDDTRAELRLQIIQDAQFQQEKKGSPLTFREEELIVSKRVGSVDVPFWRFFEDQKLISELTAEDRAKIVENPPAQLVQDAVAGLKRQGNADPTVEQIDAAIDSWLTLQGVPDASK